MNTETKHIDVTSNLVVKRGIFQVALNYYDLNNKRVQKWKSLGLKDIPGNKTQAKKLQKEVEREFEEELNTPKETVQSKGASILFGEYMKSWLNNIKSSVEPTTYASYKNKVETISEYFNALGITLDALKKSDIKEFYQHLVAERGIKAQTVKRYHANIHKALNEAVELELIQINPADKMKMDKSEQFISSYYNQQELEQLFEVAKGSIIELHILLASYYGLRREEVCGLKWSAIDFEKHTITISHTVTHCNVDGKYALVKKNRTKNTSSYRTLPLIPELEKLLLKRKYQQEQDKAKFGNTYKNKDGYILVDEEGKLILPDRVTKTFRNLLKDNGLKKIRFHDLRHSCASLLLANGVNMKEIQAYLGHSNWNTTANTYSHLESSTKEKSVNVIASVLSQKPLTAE